MSFGVSGNDKKSQMIGGDVTVAWMDHATGEKQFVVHHRGHAEISIQSLSTVQGCHLAFLEAVCKK